MTSTFGGATRGRVITVLAGVLALSSVDAATVGASAIELRQHLNVNVNVNDTDIGLLVGAMAPVRHTGGPGPTDLDALERHRPLGPVRSARCCSPAWPWDW